MEKPITTRLPEEFILRIREIAERENLDTSSVIRRLLARALEEQKLKFILEELALHKISIGKAAEELNVSVWEMINISKNNNIDWTGYSEEDFIEETKALKKSKNDI